MATSGTRTTSPPSLRRMWGDAHAFLVRRRRLSPVDLLVVVGFIGVTFALLSVGHEWTGTLQRTVEIDLSPAALPRYTLYSLSRGLLAYVFSLLFTLGYGYWAAKDTIAERALVPLLDILQSIPVLGFLRFSNAVIEADLAGSSAFHSVPELAAEVRAIVSKIEAGPA